MTISLVKVNASGIVDKNRGKIETVRPFEPSSTVVRPCTTVEGEGLSKKYASMVESGYE